MFEITICYTDYTPESIEAGDSEDCGTHDEIPLDNVSEAIEYLTTELGPRPEVSSSWFHSGVWYCGEPYTVCHRTGLARSYSYHLKGFSPKQERTVYRMLTRQYR